MTTAKSSPQALATTADGAEAALARTGSSDAAMLRVSVEVAHQFPRDEAAVISRLLATLDLYPQFAERAIYSIPYTDRRTGEIVQVTGISIRSAETMATAWGNLRVGVRIVNEDDDGWDLEAIGFDMQVNYWELVPARASKWMKTRDGRSVLLDDRQQIMARGAAASKVKRNCILAMMPLHVKAAYENKVRTLLAGGDLMKPADPSRVKAALDAFATDFSVSEARIVALIRKPTALWTGGDLANLRAIYSALADGEASVESVFPSPDSIAVTPPAQPPSGRVVEATDGAFTHQPARPIVQAETITPPVAGPGPGPAFTLDEVADLRKRLAEAEANVSAATARQTPAPSTTDHPGSAGVPPGQSGGQVPPASTVPPATDPVVSLPDVGAADIAALARSCATVQDCDELLVKLYQAGGALVGAKREAKRAALAVINDRRADIEKAARK